MCVPDTVMCVSQFIIAVMLVFVTSCIHETVQFCFTGVRSVMPSWHCTVSSCFTVHHCRGAGVRVVCSWHCNVCFTFHHPRSAGVCDVICSWLCTVLFQSPPSPWCWCSWGHVFLKLCSFVSQFIIAMVLVFVGSCVHDTVQFQVVSQSLIAMVLVFVESCIHDTV